MKRLDLNKTVEDRYYGLRRVTRLVGNGSIENPVRRIYDFYDMDGSLLFTKDTNHLNVKGDAVIA